MLLNQDIKIKELVVHQVGNVLRDEKLVLSKGALLINEEVEGLLNRYFLKPFRGFDYQVFTHESGLVCNTVYKSVKRIFNSPDAFFDESVNLAQHLYDVVTHPNIKSGEFYLVNFANCQIEGKICDAIGIFKSENKETYLKVYPSSDNFEINGDDGININKLDKGCIIYNLEEENGYIVSIVDNINKGEEARYWKDLFLTLKPRKDNFNLTGHAVELCKDFINHLPNEFEVSKADQAEVLYNTSNYFDRVDTFNADHYANTVLPDDEAKESFMQFRRSYLENTPLEVEDDFKISDAALKRQKKYFKSVIKLDKNFSLYVHGNRSLLEHGYDEQRDLKFYKLYYTEEK